MEEKEEKMLAFISTYIDNIVQVDKIILDEYDSDIGFIGEHYIVDVELSSGEKKQCAVHRGQFTRFMRKQNAVRFI